MRGRAAVLLALAGALLLAITLRGQVTSNPKITGVVDPANITGPINTTGDLTITKPGAFIVTNGTGNVGGSVSGWKLQNNGETQWDFVSNSSNDFKLNRYVGGVFQDQPITVASATGIVSIVNMVNRSGGVTYLVGGGGGAAGVGVDATGNVVQLSRSPRINTGTLTTTAAMSFNVISNRGDLDSSTINLLNDPTEGITYSVVVHTSQTITIVPAAGETLKFGNTTCGTSLSANAIGSALTLYVSGTGNGAIWVTLDSSGTWTCA